MISREEVKMPAAIRELSRSALLKMALLVLGGNIFLVLSAKAQVPFWPVPMTMQTLVVVLLGVFLGAKLGALTIALYLAEGVFGMPVFANSPERGIGISYVMGPTGGYLAGFLLAAGVAGYLSARGASRTLLGSIAILAVGHAAIFALGLAWLGALVGWNAAVAGGLTPFLIGTVVKIFLGAALIRAYSHLMYGSESAR